MKDRLTDRFRALASHYLFEPCFARPGEGHDKGGVEGRGKGIRLQHLTPIPRGQTLHEISEALLAAIDQQAVHRASRDEAVGERFREETNTPPASPGAPLRPAASRCGEHQPEGPGADREVRPTRCPSTGTRFRRPPMSAWRTSASPAEVRS